MQLSTSLRPEGHFVCQTTVYLTIAVVSFISLRVTNTDPVKDAAWSICIHFSSFLIVSKACVFPMTVSCNPTIFGIYFFNIFWAMSIDSSVNICLFKIVAFSSDENKRLFLLFEKLLPKTFTYSVHCKLVQYHHKVELHLGSFYEISPPLRYHKWHHLLEATLQLYPLSFLLFSEASFCFFVETPTLPDNADFFSFGFSKGGNFFVWFLIM